MADDAVFPLDYILNLHSITADYILPLLEPRDLARLESVNKGCQDAIGSNGNALWSIIEKNTNKIVI